MWVCGEKEDLLYSVMMAVDDVVMTINRELEETAEELIELCNGDYDEIILYLKRHYEIRGLFI